MTAAATISRNAPSVPRTGCDARLAIRAGEVTGQTAGLAPGYVQGNLAILPASVAGDFMRFCQLNPKPCPLLAASAPGDFRLPTLAADLDIRTDLPRYRVFRRGEVIDEPADIRAHWRDDLVAFVLGCSFSFEEALVEGGIELRHMTCNATVPMYRTSIATAPAGPFHGPMVVSMRPMKPADAIRAIQITTRFPAVHGAPVHIGKPEIDRHRRPGETGLGRRGAGQRRRAAGVLGLRRDTAIGGRDREARLLHHPLSRQHAGHGPPQHRVRDHVTSDDVDHRFLCVAPAPTASPMGPCR